MQKIEIDLNDKNIFFAGCGSKNANVICKSNSGSPNSKSSYDESELLSIKEINECKYCFIEDDKKYLIQPCNCLGSLRYVHEKCLCEWIQKSNKNLELTYENGIPYYCNKCELCQFQMKFQINYENNFLLTIFITLKNLLLSMEKLGYFILHIIVLSYFFNRLNFIVTNGLDVIYKNLNTICIMRFVNEMFNFVTILWYSRDIIKYYVIIFSEERKIIMKFVTRIVSKENKNLLKDLLNDLKDKEILNECEKEKYK
jgi:hypothetical protein